MNKGTKEWENECRKIRVGSSSNRKEKTRSTRVEAAIGVAAATVESFIPCFRWRGGRTWLRYSSLHLRLATCPNLIYPPPPNQRPITRWLQPADDRSLASSTRVNNTPGRMLISTLPRHHSSTLSLWPRLEHRSHTWNHFRLAEILRLVIRSWSRPPFLATLWSSTSAASRHFDLRYIEFLLLSFCIVGSRAMESTRLQFRSVYSLTVV